MKLCGRVDNGGVVEAGCNDGFRFDCWFSWIGGLRWGATQDSHPEVMTVHQQGTRVFQAGKMG